MTSEEEGDMTNGIEMIRKKVVEEWGSYPYHHQMFNLYESPNWRYPLHVPESAHLQVLQEFYYFCDEFKSFDFSIKPMKVGGVRLCNYSELKQITDFELQSFIQQTHSGRLFHGTFGPENQPVIVKTCDLLLPYRDGHAERLPRFFDEIELFIDEKANTHKHLAKLCTFCCDKRLAAVYDEKFALSLSDALLDVGSITASCIMLDEELNIKVFDFGFVSNHVNEDSKIHVDFLVGREAPEVLLGKRTMKSDVYMFALLLLELITKKEYEYKILDVVECGEKQLVDESFSEVDDATASEITQLISKCLIDNADKRPTMKEVYDALKAMRARGEKRKRAESESE